MIEHRGNLIPVVAIHSVLADAEIVHKCEPYLEMTCGAWIRGKACVPKFY
jgi:CRISPR-associated protein Csx3